MRFWKWLATRWRYDLATLMAVTMVVLLLTGRITVDAAMGFVMVIVTLLAADLRPQLERHRAEMVKLLQEVALAGKAASAHNVPAALQAGVQVAEDGAKLATEVEKEQSA